MIQVVCFDIGGVMIRITQLWSVAAENAGVKLKEGFDPKAALVEAPGFDAYQEGSITEEEYLDRLSVYLGTNTHEALLVHNNILLRPYDGIEKIVEDLKSRGTFTACLSNTNELHWVAINESGRFPANEKLDLRLASHLLKLQKPDPAIYKVFEEACKHPASEIAFFDDSLPNVTEALALGWKAFHIDPTQETAPQIIAALRSLGIAA